MNKLLTVKLTRNVHRTEYTLPGVHDGLCFTSLNDYWELDHQPDHVFVSVTTAPNKNSISVVFQGECVAVEQGRKTPGVHYLLNQVRTALREAKVKQHEQYYVELWEST